MKRGKVHFIIIAGVVFAMAFTAFAYIGYVNVNRRIEYNRLSEDVVRYIQEFPGEVGVYIKDMRTGAVIKFNEDKLFPSASLIKIPVMGAVLYSVSENTMSFNERITLRGRHKVGGSGRIRRYRSGSKFTVIELVERMITESDNTATNILTDMMGFNRINEIIKDQLYMKTTNMSRGIMDLRARRRGFENYTTARDIAELLEKIYRGGIISEKMSATMLNILLKQKSKDRLPRLLPDGLQIAHKTGMMRDACHDAGIIFTDNGDFVVCVLTGDYKSLRVAKTLISDIAFRTYRCY